MRFTAPFRDGRELPAATRFPESNASKQWHCKSFLLYSLGVKQLCYGWTV